VTPAERPVVARVAARMAVGKAGAVILRERRVMAAPWEARVAPAVPVCAAVRAGRAAQAEADRWDLVRASRAIRPRAPWARARKCRAPAELPRP
jgi:hypothetical protein